MADLVFILVVLAFFAACAAYVRFCERIIARGESTAEPVQGVSHEVVG